MNAYVCHRASLPNTQLASKARRAGLMTSYRMSPTYHYIRARGLGGDGPKDIISSVSAELLSHFVTTASPNRKLKNLRWLNDHCQDKQVYS